MAGSHIFHELPLTHYDRALKIRPNMWEYLQKDVEYLRLGGTHTPIASVDDFSESNLSACVEHYVDATVLGFAASSGIPISDIAPVVKKMPQMTLLIHGIVSDYHNILNFELFGRKTFYFGINLSEHLLATELSVDSSLLMPPFDSCMFVYTAPSVVETAFAFMKVQAEPVDLLYPVSVYITSLPDKTSNNGRKILMAVSHWRGDQYSFYIKREVAIRPGWKIEKSLQTDWEALGDTDGEGLRLTSDGDNRTTTDEEFYTDGLDLFRLILNSILYLSSNDPDIIERTSGRSVAIKRAQSIKSALKAKKARQTANKESTLDYYSVGESVSPIYIDKHALHDSNNSQLNKFKEYAIRFIVRGHWRNQPCGQHFTERKLIWIKPYYKGPEMTGLVSRPYIVK